MDLAAWYVLYESACALLATRAKPVLGYIERSIADQSKGVIVPALVQPQLEYCVPLWAPQ